MNIIITGGTKGIGRAIAETFAREGFNIGLCARTGADLDQTKKALQKINPSIEIHTKSVDVRKKAAVQDFARFAKTHLGEIDVLVNNAGIFVPGDIHKEEEGTLETLIETNLYSAYHLTRVLLPGMIARRSGHIFNICSVASLLAYPNGGSYSISKFALLGFSKVLREEMKDKGIRVTSVIPGATWTDSWAGSGLPESRFMEANDIALTLLNAFRLSKTAVVEEIIVRPQLGDL